MRILFDSRLQQFKTPFGTLIPRQSCTLHIAVPADVHASAVACVLLDEKEHPFQTVSMAFERSADGYVWFGGSFSFAETGLFFYYFQITAPTGVFRLFRFEEGDTNMEAGQLWQISCIPADFFVPEWAKNALFYQIFPDRFAKSGSPDLREKLTPFTLHENWNEEVSWAPSEDEEIWNNDFFGGNFRGIAEKMEYFESLGVTAIYLNPISKSFSSHRYDTGDYKKPDPMLGTEEDFSELCKIAHNHNIYIVLDGVFSHTGSDSIYFDIHNRFGGTGAYCTQDSPYTSWYTFTEWPEKYKSWWDFKTLPTVNKMDPGFLAYIITDEDSVIAHWLSLGADGFRLDVADELPNEFLKLLKQKIRQIKPDALLIGEVWEDASNKIAYSTRKRYFVDGVLDSVMNYPLRTAILQYVRKEDHGQNLRKTVLTLAENYPSAVSAANLNLLGSHDTPRILTALVDSFDGTREENARRKLTAEQYQKAVSLLEIASVLQFTLPGSPCIYYGDEAGMEGAKDPFNRRTYPWGHENAELLAHYRLLGTLRKSFISLRRGEIHFTHAEDGKIRFSRTFAGETVTVSCNLSDTPWDVPNGQLLLGYGMDTVRPDALRLGANGICIVKS